MNVGKFIKKLGISILLTAFLTTGIPGMGLLSNQKISAASISLSNYQTDSRIRLNSIGFVNDLSKKATIVGSCTEFQIANANGEVVYSSQTTSMNNSDTSEQVWIADFSSVNTSGSYYLVVPGIGKSVNFKIGNDVYNEAFKTSMLGMYLMRCGTSVSANYNGKYYSHNACHTNDAFMDYIGGGHTKKDGQKGWHDAGDYNKYVVNAGVTVGSMFMAWEQFKDKIQPITISVPESSNSIPDFLDEMKWEMDWLFTMQYSDGSGKVSHKLTTKGFGGFILPESESTERFFSPWGTAATADFVAMMAMASRSFKPYDTAYADKCLAAAKTSYSCLVANPSNVNPDISMFTTGGYTTTDSDDRLWAAAEMWETTGDSTYLADFESRANGMSVKVDSDFDWGNVKNLGMYTYLLSSKTGKSETIYNTIKSALLSTSDSIVNTAKGHGYGRPLGTNYYWGCNGSVARQTMILQVANKLSPKIDYLNTAQDALSHIFGRNYYNRSFVTGMGINPPMNPHDRRSGGDNVQEPWPGCIVGGGWPGAKDWKDIQDDYETNEIAINWSGAFIYALAGLANFESTPIATPTQIPQPTFTPTPTNIPTNYIYGDVSNDGRVDSSDYTLMRRYLLSIISTLPNPDWRVTGDVNKDNRVDSADYTLLRKYLLRQIDVLPYVK